MYKIWYEHGLEESIKNGEEIEWIKDFFESRKDDICYGGCHTIVTIDRDDLYYTIELNGNDNEEISFIIQDEKCDNLDFFWTVNTDETIQDAFDSAYSTFIEYCNEL